MTERIVEKEGSWWIALNHNDKISDSLLDELREKHNNYFDINFDIKLFQDDEIFYCPSFYDHMADHPRLEEFLEADVNNILSKFGDDNKVARRFVDIAEKTLTRKIRANNTWNDTISTIKEYFWLTILSVLTFGLYTMMVYSSMKN